MVKPNQAHCHATLRPDKLSLRAQPDSRRDEIDDGPGGAAPTMFVLIRLMPSAAIKSKNQVWKIVEIHTNGDVHIQRFTIGIIDKHPVGCRSNDDQLNLHRSANVGKFPEVRLLVGSEFNHGLRNSSRILSAASCARGSSCCSNSKCMSSGWATQTPRTRR